MQKSEIILQKRVTTTIRINKKKKPQNLIIYFKIKLHNKIEKKKKERTF